MSCILEVSALKVYERLSCLGNQVSGAEVPLQREGYLGVFEKLHKLNKPHSLQD